MTWKDHELILVPKNFFLFSSFFLRGITFLGVLCVPLRFYRYRVSKLDLSSASFQELSLYPISHFCRKFQKSFILIRSEEWLAKALPGIVWKGMVPSSMKPLLTFWCTIGAFTNASRIEFFHSPCPFESTYQEHKEHRRRNVSSDALFISFCKKFFFWLERYMRGVRWLVMQDENSIPKSC